MDIGFPLQWMQILFLSFSWEDSGIRRFLMTVSCFAENALKVNWTVPTGTKPA